MPVANPTPESKHIRDSIVTLSQMMRLEHANLHGNVHGGIVMKLVDEAGALTCMRHAQHPVVTVAMDNMSFRHPIQIGDLVTLTSRLTYVGRTSMEVRVEVEAENPFTGNRVHTNTAHLVYVALDTAGRPVPVPVLILESPEEQHEFAEAEARQGQRRAQRPAAGTSE